MSDIKNEDLTLELIPQTIKDRPGSFAHSFNGYEYGGSFEACVDISTKVRLAIEANKTEGLTLSELRTCLFFHYRAIRHNGDRPNEAKVNTLLELIRDRISKNNIE